MDESALRILLDHLERFRSSLDSWLIFWTLLVAIGVFLEVVFVIWEYREDLHDFRRGIIHPPERPNGWLLVFGLFGSGLIALGVTGELWIGKKIGAVETEIRNANDDRAALLSKETGDAKKSAESAAAAAAKAKEEADAVEAKAGALTFRLETASRQVSALDQDILALGPRWRLLKNGKTAFIAALRPFPGQRVTIVICGQDDSERAPLEQMLFNSFAEAGWSKPGYVQWKNCPTSSRGGNQMFFASPADTNTKQWAGAYFCRPSPNLSGVEAAAQALCGVLNKLRIETMTFKEILVQDGGMKARDYWGDGIEGSPGEMAMQHPDTIFLLIRQNLPVFEDERTQRPKQPPPK